MIQENPPLPLRWEGHGRKSALSLLAEQLSTRPMVRILLKAACNMGNLTDKVHRFIQWPNHPLPSLQLLKPNTVSWLLYHGDRMTYSLMFPNSLTSCLCVFCSSLQVWLCDYENCEKTYSDKRDLLFHRRSRHNIGQPIVCQHCLLSDFRSRTGYRRHVKQCAPQVIVANSNKDSSDKW